MGWFREAMRGLNGYAPLRELEEVTRGVDRARRRRVSRIVTEGGRVDDVADAEVAVAIARDRQRQARLAGPWVWVAFGLVLVTVAGVGIGELIGGRPVPAVFFIVLAIWLTIESVRQVRRRRRAPAAERENRALLLEHGRTYPYESTALAADSFPQLLVSAGCYFLLVTGVSGVVTELMDDEPLTLLGVLREGALFGVTMTVFVFTIGRAWNRRAAQTR